MGYFFDPLDGGRVRLELRSVDGSVFSLLRRIGYQADGYDAPFVVPADLATFRTDLASVPDLFTWLVPVSGLFAPAAVLHDSITDNSHVGPRLERTAADRIFRLAMRDLGTGIIRAWLMWAAVTIATLWVAPDRARRLPVLLTFGLVIGLGAVSTLDLIDVWNVLPWMGDRPWWIELLTGGAAAVIVPGILAATWGRLWAAGLINGWALAILLHVTIVLAIIYGAYLVVERIVSGPADERGLRPRHKTAPPAGLRPLLAARPDRSGGPELNRERRTG